MFEKCLCTSVVLYILWRIMLLVRIARCAMKQLRTKRVLLTGYDEQGTRESAVNFFAVTCDVHAMLVRGVIF